MPAHPEFLAAFDRALRGGALRGGALHGGALPPGVTARDPAEAARRFDVYRNNVAVGLIAALGARFPAIRRLLGDDYFRALARLYAEADRPASPVLADWGAGFAAFLAGFAPLAGWPYLADVARIEWARGRAFHAADARPIDPRSLAGADPDRLRLRLHPSVAVLWLAHPAVTIWAVNQPGAAARPIPAGPEIALVLRDRGFGVPVRAIGAGDAALITALAAGQSLAEAAARALGEDPAHAVADCLGPLLAAGAIVEDDR